MIKKILYPTYPFFSSLQGRADKKTGTKNRSCGPKIKVYNSFAKNRMIDALSEQWLISF